VQLLGTVGEGDFGRVEGLVSHKRNILTTEWCGGDQLGGVVECLCVLGACGGGALVGLASACAGSGWCLWSGRAAGLMGQVVCIGLVDGIRIWCQLGCHILDG